MILRFSELPLAGLGRLAVVLNGWMEGGGGYIYLSGGRVRVRGVGWGDGGRGKGVRWIGRLGLG